MAMTRVCSHAPSTVHKCSVLPLHVGLCQLVAFVQWLNHRLTKQDFDVLVKAVLTLVGIAAGVTAIILSITGKIAPWTGRYAHDHFKSFAR